MGDRTPLTRIDMSKVTLETGLIIENCCSCGISFAVPESWLTKKRRDHSAFFCPNGHSLHYSGNSDLEKAKQEIERLQGRAATSQQNAKYWRNRTKEEQRSKAAYKGHLTRTKNRIAAGVCPCCNRTFENLRQHMETKHPDYLETNQH